MILVNTSVWVDHLRTNNEALAGLLNIGAVLAHPFIIGELALGQMRQREVVLTSLTALPRAAIATDADVLRFIERHALFGRGIGYIDVHLLVAARLTEAASLWTSDRRLHSIADELSLAATPPFDYRALA